MQKKLQEILPKAGLVYSEKGNLSEVLSKPKIMPIKSITLEKIEQMEKEAANVQKLQATNGKL
jgi:BBSome-interacting protein 1